MKTESSQHLEAIIKRGVNSVRDQDVPERLWLSIKSEIQSEQSGFILNWNMFRKKLLNPLVITPFVGAAVALFLFSPFNVQDSSLLLSDDYGVSQFETTQTYYSALDYVLYE